MRASVDIGSNSLLLLVVDDAGRAVHDEATVVGLGRGLGETGAFREDRLAHAREVLARYAATAVRLGVAPSAVRAVATSASRRATNAAAFYAGVREATGLQVEVISGEEEARLTWEGAFAGVTLPEGPRLLCDPGGGSTEVSVGTRDGVAFRTSLEIGTVRLTEAFLGYGEMDPAAFARMCAHVDAHIDTLGFDVVPRSAVAVAGTATTLCAAQLGLTRYDGARVHGAPLTGAALRGWIDALKVGGPADRRARLPVGVERADTLLAGAVILERVLARAGLDAYVTSDRGMRWALV
jgi:exopolyphosphatase/guanosine-5'-triphosphate,3'-diphosphate pyrophosphatase